MKSLPYFPFYPGEWLRSPTVLGMTLEEQGAYLRLLCAQWEDGFIDPEDMSLLLNVSQEQVDEWFGRRSWRRAFEKGPDGMLRNGRLAIERETALQKIENASAAANARWAKHRKDGKPKLKRRNAEAELQAALADVNANGVEVPEKLASAMTEYMNSRREGRHRVWSKEQWLKNMDASYTFDELTEAFRTAAKAGWGSVHPKKAGQLQRKQNQALTSLQEWVEHDDLPY